MSVRMPNVLSAAPPAVPVLCPSPGLDLPPQNPGSTVSLHRELLGDGDGRVPSGSRIPFPLVQGYAYGRDDRSALCAAAQVPPLPSEAVAQVSTYFPMCPKVRGFLWLLQRIRRLLLVLIPRCLRLGRLLGGCRGSCSAARDGESSARPLCSSL